jgi:AcrR family transcriptional regulator
MGVNRAASRTATQPEIAAHQGKAAGRRRDPTIDAKLRRAARMLYAHEGWAGLHFEGVARAAGVSKDAVYRRYADAKSLLLDALSEQVVPTLAGDRPIEEALVAYACDVFSYFASGNGYANLRVHIDGAQYPDILQQYRVRVVEPQIAQAVGVLESAREGGRIHPDTSCTAVIEALGGAVMFHALVTMPSCAQDAAVPNPATVRQLSEFVDQVLYGRLVHGLGARSSAARSRRRPTARR